jgi:DNA-binding transcriptional regulator YbjK
MSVADGDRLRQTSDMPQPVPSPAQPEIASAARDLVAAEGLRGLSLRKVAARAGAGLGKLSYQIGAKQDLILLLIDHVHQEQLANHAAWLARVARSDLTDAALLAAVIGGYLDHAAIGRRPYALAVCELQLEPAFETSARASLQRLFEAEYAFWRSALERASDGRELADAIACFCRDELPFSIAVGSDPDYRLLRATSIARLAARFRPDRDRGFMEAFEPLVAAMDAHAIDVIAPMVADADTRRGRIAEAVAIVIAVEGIAAVTHRAVAAAAGAPNSTVAHYFRTRQDLLRAGLQALYLGASRTHAGALSILRASHAMALAAARDASLAPFALDLRRRRGIQVRAEMMRRFDGEVPLDGAAAQVMAMVLIGSGVEIMALGRPEPRIPTMDMDRLERIRAGAAE